ncbi:hypothetical protein [Microbulbifer sp. ZKSA002]|uniref:hypothetical protein n=1 Tax=Microbulbifer sp. ZKSA002 TaxID=3243388 RepID=UPI0040390FA3
MKKVIYILLSLFYGNAEASSEDIDILLKNATEREGLRKAQIERILDTYDLEKWIFTSRVVVDENAIRPSSHPVLTFNVKRIGSDESFLASFLHEQIHWFEEKNKTQVSAAIEDLKKIYPNVPKKRPDGARDEYSTYLHLIVCYLEYDGLRQNIGDERATEIISKNSEYFYKWIYKAVLNDGEAIRKVIEAHTLRI